MSKYKSGDTFIIKIEKELGDGLYKMKGFNALVFDENGLDRLSRELVTPSSYFKGWKSGMEDGWEMAARVINFPANIREALFGYTDPKYIFRIYSSEEVKDILRRYNPE